MVEDQKRSSVDQFITEQIDTVPHLEALLLLWNSRPVAWMAEQLGLRLFISAEAADRILQDLSRKGLVTIDPSTGRHYTYYSTAANDHLMASVDDAYRKELVRLSQIIHSKGSPAAQDFARAFRWKKD